MTLLRTLFRKEIFLILLPLFFVIHGFVAHYPAIPLKDAIFVFLRYLVLSGAMVLLIFILFRSFRKAAWFTFWLFVLQFLFGPFHDGLKAASPNAIFVKHIFLFPFFVALFTLFFFYLKRTNKTFTKAIFFVNVLLCLWLIIDLVQLAAKDPEPQGKMGAFNKKDCATCNYPDVYFIVADEYAGKVPLMNVFGFDNTLFENNLRQRGFHIINNTTSNYNYTPYSIASILSMNYIEGITVQSNNRTNLSLAYNQINKADIVTLFDAMGYAFVNLSPFDFAGKPTEVSTQFFQTRQTLITGQTYTHRLFKDIGFNFVTRIKIKPLLEYWTSHTLEINEKFLKETRQTASAASKTPRFIYTHLFMPHYPYYFNDHGDEFPVESLVEGEQVNKEQYIAYLKYCNNKFLNMIDHIIKQSKKPPVILFMGDHGFRHFETTQKKYHFMNFNAVLLPNKKYDPFYDAMSGVNQFRSLLNAQFGYSLPKLKDSTSFLTEY